jgi:hypothetical protein
MPAVTHLGCFAGVLPSFLPLADRPSPHARQREPSGMGQCRQAPPYLRR